MKLNDIRNVAEEMWGNHDVNIKKTKIKGIYDVSTSRHGGFLVDIDIHPILKKYGYKTINESINAFEEDYEALKVLWLYPELINNMDNIDEWLNEKTVIRFDNKDTFLKDFPNRKTLIENEEECEEEL